MSIFARDVDAFLSLWSHYSRSIGLELHLVSSFVLVTFYASSERTYDLDLLLIDSQKLVSVG